MTIVLQAKTLSYILHIINSKVAHRQWSAIISRTSFRLAFWYGLLCLGLVLILGEPIWYVFLDCPHFKWLHLRSSASLLYQIHSKYCQRLSNKLIHHIGNITNIVSKSHSYNWVNEKKLTKRTKRTAAAVAAAGQWLNAHLTSKLPTMCNKYTFASLSHYLIQSFK